MFADTDGDEAFVERVERRIERLLDERGAAAGDGSRVADEAAGYLARASAAKRARPRLLFHFGRALGLGADRLIDLAAAAELVHTASLLHDDVVDDAATRRGLEAVNARWSNQVAILGGDLLLCHSLKLLEPFEAAVYHSAVDVVGEMTRGIMREVEVRRDIATTLADWHMIAMGKTGALLGWCGRAPALVAGRADLVERFERCGRHLGVAFQLADDLKDLLAVETGKDRFADIKNGNPSYVLISALASSPIVRQRLEELWAEPAPASAKREVERAGLLVLESDAVKRTVAAIDEAVAQAMAALGSHSSHAGGRQVRRWTQLLIHSVEQMAGDYL